MMCFLQLRINFREICFYESRQKLQKQVLPKISLFLSNRQKCKKCKTLSVSKHEGSKI